MNTKVSVDYTQMGHSHLTAIGKTVMLCWIPSNVNIPGNEKADLAAYSKCSVTKLLTLCEWRWSRVATETPWPSVWWNMLKPVKQKLASLSGGRCVSVRQTAVAAVSFKSDWISGMCCRTLICSWGVLLSQMTHGVDSWLVDTKWAGCDHGASTFPQEPSCSRELPSSQGFSHTTLAEFWIGPRQHKLGRTAVSWLPQSWLLLDQGLRPLKSCCLCCNRHSILFPSYWRQSISGSETNIWLIKLDKYCATQRIMCWQRNVDDCALCSIDETIGNINVSCEWDPGWNLQRQHLVQSSGEVNVIRWSDSQTTRLSVLLWITGVNGDQRRRDSRHHFIVSIHLMTKRKDVQCSWWSWIFRCNHTCIECVYILLCMLTYSDSVENLSKSAVKKKIFLPSFDSLIFRWATSAFT